MKTLSKSNDKMLCGVCAGIAEYINIDPTIIRVIWVLYTLLSGIGLFAYIVCSLVMPDKEI